MDLPNCMKYIRIFCLLILAGSTNEIKAADYHASLFGIKSDGITLNTRSIQTAINFINEKGGGRLVFSVGRYLSGSIHLKTNVTLELKEGAVLVGSTSIYDYLEAGHVKGLIVSEGQQNIGIMGKGVIDGQGPAVLASIQAQIKKGYLASTVEQASPAIMAFHQSKKVMIDGLFLQNSCGSVISMELCQELVLKGTVIKSTSVPGNAGIRLSSCEGVEMTRLYIETQGKAMSSDGNSKEIVMTFCKNAEGKILVLKQ